MSRHEVTIRSGDRPGTASVEIDGRRVKGLLGYTVHQHIFDCPRAVVTIEMQADVVAGVSVDPESLIGGGD